MSTSADGEKPVNPDLDEVKKERPVRKRRRVFGEKICQVCGDKALAHHFGTLACETCKAFFRRNASIKVLCQIVIVFYIILITITHLFIYWYCSLVIKTCIRFKKNQINVFVFFNFML